MYDYIRKEINQKLVSQREPEKRVKSEQFCHFFLETTCFALSVELRLVFKDKFVSLFSLSCRLEITVRHDVKILSSLKKKLRSFCVSSKPAFLDILTFLRLLPQMNFSSVFLHSVSPCF